MSLSEVLSVKQAIPLSGWPFNFFTAVLLLFYCCFTETKEAKKQGK